MPNTGKLSQRRERFDRPEYRQQRVVPLIVLAVSLSLTWAIYQIAHLYVEARDQIRIDSEINKTETAVRTRMAAYGDLIYNSAASFQIDGVPKPSKFERLSQAIGVMDHYPGITGFGYGEWVEHDRKKAFIQWVRRNGKPNYEIFPVTSEAAVPVVMRHPITRPALQTLGYDMWSSAPRREAMSRAKERGTVSLTRRTDPPPNSTTPPEPSFVLYAPVYLSEEAESPGERPLKGFVYAGFRAGRLFREIFSARSGIDMWVRIYDGTHADPRSFLYENVPYGTKEPVVSQKVVEIYNRPWTIQYIPKPGLTQSGGEGVVRWFPLFGVLISLLLAGLSYGQVRANDVLMRQARELHRREAHMSLLSRSSTALAGSYQLDIAYGRLAAALAPQFADHCWIALVGDDVRLIARSDAGSFSFPAFGALPEPLLRGEAVWSDAVSPQHRNWYPFQKSGVAAATLCTPIIVQGRTVGVIGLVETMDRGYDAEDVRLANQVASRAAVAYEAATLFAEREHEIRERRAAEARVREVNENLEKLVTERTRELIAANNELEAFCYSVSHDLRGPLRSVDGFSRALMEDYGDRLDAEGHEFIERVRRAAKRMDELISALLSLSRLTRAELAVQQTNVSEMAEEVARELVRGTDGVKVSIQPGLYAIADPRMLRILLDNLIGNAVKFSRENPNPEVTIGRKDGAFFVSDNGVGFNMQYVNKLFVPFERLHPASAFPGTGIGLATVQRIAARHGGHVWAEGEEGKGATFYFTLPESKA